MKQEKKRCDPLVSIEAPHGLAEVHHIYLRDHGLNPFGLASWYMIDPDTAAYALSLCRPPYTTWTLVRADVDRVLGVVFSRKNFWIEEERKDIFSRAEAHRCNRRKLLGGDFNAVPVCGLPVAKSVLEHIGEHHRLCHVRDAAWRASWKIEGMAHAQQKKEGADMAEMTMKITVQKTELIRRLEENKARHQAMVAEAREGFLRKAHEALDRELEKLKEGRCAGIMISVHAPVDHTRDYDEAIRMARLHQFDILEMTWDTAQVFLEDKWPWFRAALAMNSAYSRTAMLLMESGEQ